MPARYSAGMVTPLLRSVGFALGALATTAIAVAWSPARAADWLVQSSTGTALVLRNDKWVDLTPDEVLSGAFTLRTLGGASLSVGTSGAAISIGPGAAVAVAEQGPTVRIELIAGSVAAAVERERRAHVVAGTVGVDLAGGAAEVSLTKDGARVHSRTGLVSVHDGSRDSVELMAPGSAAAFGPAAPQVTSAGGEPAESTGQGSEGDTPGGSQGNQGDGASSNAQGSEQDSGGGGGPSSP